MKETFINLMMKSLAETFILYLKIHNYHWNIEGENFIQYHKFLGDLYDEVFDSIDDIAEHIRTLDIKVPGSCSTFKELSEINEEEGYPDSDEIFENLLEDNETLIKTFNLTMKFALQNDKQGIANYLADRIDKHEKYSWMIRSITKNG